MVTDDKIRFLASMTVSVPLSFALRYIPSLEARYWFSLITGTAIQVYIYGYGVFLFFLMHAFIYALLHMRPHSCGGLINIISMVMVSAVHLFYMIVYYGVWEMDLTLFAMFQVTRYSLLGYAVEDGHKRGKRLTAEQERNKL
jgi:hypothetical protein